MGQLRVVMEKRVVVEGHVGVMVEGQPGIMVEEQVEVMVVG